MREKIINAVELIIAFKAHLIFFVSRGQKKKSDQIRSIFTSFEDFFFWFDLTKIFFFHHH